MLSICTVGYVGITRNYRSLHAIEFIVSVLQSSAGNVNRYKHLTCECLKYTDVRVRISRIYSNIGKFNPRPGLNPGNLPVNWPKLLGPFQNDFTMFFRCICVWNVILHHFR